MTGCVLFKGSEELPRLPRADGMGRTRLGHAAGSLEIPRAHVCRTAKKEALPVLVQFTQKKTEKGSDSFRVRG